MPGAKTAERPKALGYAKSLCILVIGNSTMGNFTTGKSGGGANHMTARKTLSRRRLIMLSAGCALGAPAVLRAAPAKAAAKPLYVNSYGGVWETSWRKAFFDPFTAQTGIEIKTVPGVSFAKLKAQVTTGNYEYDQTNLGDSEFAQAVHEGLLDKVDAEAAGTAALPPHMVRDYGIVSYSLGTNIVYRTDKFPNGGPRNWADFWNVQKFPGSRCLFDRSFTCLAFALIADGVPIDKLYPLDLDRAFRKMDQIKPHIKVWWHDGAQSQQLIRDGEVDMIGMWSARALDLIDDHVPLEIVWDGGELYWANLVVPKGDPNAKAAWQFANFVAQPQPQANFAMLLPYGPANPAARALMPEARLKQTPAWPGNEKVMFQHDAAWLAPRLAQIRERWTQWMTS
jgi:putative spermidine/putrescine transport system substrate-binding protein